MIRDIILDLPLEHLGEPLTSSWLGSVFKIEFELKVVCKFDQYKGKDKFEATFPLKIMQSPNITPSDEPYRVPDEWNPIQPKAEVSYLPQPSTYSDYYK